MSDKRINVVNVATDRAKVRHTASQLGIEVIEIEADGVAVMISVDWTDVERRSNVVVSKGPM